MTQTLSAAVNGLNAVIVRVEVSVGHGMQCYITGLAEKAVKESRLRVAAAIKNSGFRYPQGEITVNLSPADIKKDGSGYDLPMAIAFVALDESQRISHLGEYVMVGELGLDGRLLPVSGVLPVAIKARADHYKGLIVPRQNVKEASVVNNLEVYGMDSLRDVVTFLSDQSSPEPVRTDVRRDFQKEAEQFGLDFSDVRGQEAVKRALEVAAAGGHNLIMIGPPGSGKSMMAKRLPSILPPLSLAESLETTQIHSVAGKLSRNTSLLTQRPFVAPHHTVSPVALVGGGNNAAPGSISLAHNGVLFCDEFKRKHLLHSDIFINFAA